MVGESLTFACPVCQTRLTVPVQLAGVIGPCPSCGTRIQAPQTTARQPSFPEETDPSFYQSGAAVSPGAIPPPTRYPAQRAATIETNVGRAPYQSASEPAPPLTHMRPTHGEVHARLHRRGRRRFLRPLIFPALLILVAGILYGTLLFLRGRDAPKKKRPLPVTAPSSQNVGNVVTPPAVPAPLPVAPPDHTNLVPVEPETPQNLHAKRPGIVAREVVDAFCQAKALQERLPLIETGESPETLAKTPLAGPLPFASDISQLSQDTNENENLIDFYFKVAFKDVNGRENVHTILARKRGDAEPKVVVAPFLDLYGGRLAAFAAHPTTDGAGATFHAIAYAMGSCTNDDIPDKEKKFTLHLLSVEAGKEYVASTYFDKNSKIAEMLADDSYDFSFGEYRPCTVYLTWNPNGGKPYLEALQIKSLNWNP